MKIIDQKFIRNVVSVNRKIKNTLLCLMDYFSLVFVFWLSLSLRVNEIFIPDYRSTLVILISVLFSIPILYLTGQYKSLIRYINVCTLIADSHEHIYIFTLCIFINLKST